MSLRRSRAFLVLLCTPLLAPSATIAADSFDYDPKHDPTAPENWRESVLALPPYPEDRNLVAVPLAAADTFRLYIDRTSLARTDDLLARATLVVESPSGARSVFYEAIRCETRQHKTYAVGGSDRRWRPIRDTQWRYIDAKERHGFRFQLYQSYLCDGTHTARTPAAALRAVTER